jgi:CBS domain-containing protein
MKESPAMQVKKVMSQDPKCCTPEMSLQEAAQMMVACDCGAIPVVDSDDHAKPIGVITDRDIACRAVAEGKDPVKTKVRDCMTTHLVCVLPEASMEECCEVMEKNQVRRLLVADHENRLRGIISQADIALYLSKNKAAEVVKQVSQPSEAPSAMAV